MLFRSFGQIGSAMGVAVIGVVFFGVVGTNFSPGNLRDAFESAIWVSLAAVALTGLSSFLLPSVAQVVAHKQQSEEVAD